MICIYSEIRESGEIHGRKKKRKKTTRKRKKKKEVNASDCEERSGYEVLVQYTNIHRKTPITMSLLLSLRKNFRRPTGCTSTSHL